MKSNVQKAGLLFVAFSLIGFHNGALAKKKRVCIIGAGRAGLAAIKLTVNNRFEPIAFERNSDVGGLWIYRDHPELDEHGLPAHSGIYKSLKVNDPKVYMVYPDYHAFEDYGRVTASHEAFLQYMRNYTAKFNLRRYIQFDTMVTKVFPVKGDGDWMTTTWRVETRNLNTNKESTIGCDAVMVCNGEYSKPIIPDIPGLESFRGRVLHSRSYRKPQDFTGKTVVILGAGNTATDISLELSEYAKHVYVSVYNPRYKPRRITNNLDLVHGVAEANDSQLILRDNSIIKADAIIFCVGYAYDFPFLDERSGIVYDAKRFHPIYKRSINVEHPSMAFIGFDFALNYGRLYYKQSREFLKILKGTKKLPCDQQAMLDKSRRLFPELATYSAIRV